MSCYLILTIVKNFNKILLSKFMMQREDRIILYSSLFIFLMRIAFNFEFFIFLKEVKLAKLTIENRNYSSCYHH